MRTYKVEWSYNARGVQRLQASSPEEAERIVDDMDLDTLFASAERGDWEREVL